MFAGGDFAAAAAVASPSSTTLELAAENRFIEKDEVGSSTFKNGCFKTCTHTYTLSLFLSNERKPTLYLTYTRSSALSCPSQTLKHAHAHSQTLNDTSNGFLLL